MKTVTNEELQQIQNLRETLLEIITVTGELSLTKFMTETQLNEVIANIKTQQERFVDFQEKERVLFEQLQQKYGTGNINFETGEIVE
jgi:Flp pilus assembly CpaE family ATPase